MPLATHPIVRRLLFLQKDLASALAADVAMASTATTTTLMVTVFLFLFLLSEAKRKA